MAWRDTWCLRPNYRQGCRRSLRRCTPIGASVNRWVRPRVPGQSPAFLFRPWWRDIAACCTTETNDECRFEGRESLQALRRAARAVAGRWTGTCAAVWAVAGGARWNQLGRETHLRLPATLCIDTARADHGGRIRHCQGFGIRARGGRIAPR